ncbi:MAG: J domain-containing protein [Flavobacteriales bacterium]
MEQPLRYDHYKVLGIPRDASTDAITRAYRERAMQWHPDRNPSARASEAFRALHEAYLTLKDHRLRADYDARLRFYRAGQLVLQTQQRRRPVRGARAAGTRHPSAIDRAAFKGLHLTGLLFGSTLVATILVGCLWMGWPPYVLLFSAPGLAVLPDSLEGLRWARPGRHGYTGTTHP